VARLREALMGKPWYRCPPSIRPHCVNRSNHTGRRRPSSTTTCSPRFPRSGIATPQHQDQIRDRRCRRRNGRGRALGRRGACLSASPPPLCSVCPPPSALSFFSLTFLRAWPSLHGFCFCQTSPSPLLRCAPDSHGTTGCVLDDARAGPVGASCSMPVTCLVPCCFYSTARFPLSLLAAHCCFC
jgi:hypothetical protein